MKSKEAMLRTITAIYVSAALFAPGPRPRAAEDEVACEDVAALSSTDRHLAADSLGCLFDRGREALPELVQELNNEAPFHGSRCGYGGFSSETIPVEVDATFPEDRKRMVSETVLYVIESILRENCYFAEICHLYLDGKDSLDLPEVQSRVRKMADALGRLEPSEQRALSLDDFRSLMVEYALSFPGTR